MTSFRKIIDTIRPENAFVLLAVTFGIALTFITPPFQSPDEYHHMYRAYHCSEGGIIGEKQGDKLGGDLPENLTVMMQPFRRLMYRSEEKIEIQTIQDALYIQIEADRRVFTRFNNTALYSPAAYIPQTIGIIIGRLTSSSPLVMMYLGRLLNLIFWITLIYWAIKITPIHKWSIFLLALMPMSIFLAPTLSADPTTNGVSFLLISIILFLTYSREVEKIGSQYLLIILGCGIILILSKIAYSPLLFLYFLVPRRKFLTRAEYTRKTLLLFAVFALTFVGWSFLVSSIHVPIETPGASVNGQALHILNHPICFAEAIVDSYKKRYIFILMSFIGILGWLDTPLAHYHFMGYLFALFLVAIIDSDSRVTIEPSKRLYILGVLLMSWLTLVILVFMVTVPVGGMIYQGFQGRWHIPMAPLVFLLFYNRQIVVVNKGLIRRICIGTAGISLMLVVFQLINRYYLV